MHLCRRLLLLLAILVGSLCLHHLYLCDLSVKFFLQAALYTFFCSLATLSRGFRLISTSADGSLPKEHLTNPAVGLLIGTLGTAVIQSSSTVTSFVVALVASGSITVKEAIPIVMGSNVGTSLTSGLVAFLHIRTPEKFKVGFTVAIMHDVFNWMSILILLPVECLTDVLGKTSHSMVEALYQDKQRFNHSLFHNSPLFFLEASVVDNIVKLKPAHLPKDCHATTNSSSISEAWQKLEQFKDLKTEETLQALETLENQSEESCSLLETDCEGGCSYLLASTGLSDVVIGVIIVVCSLTIFILSYIVLFTSLKTLLAADPRSGSKRIPGLLSYLKGKLLALPYLTDLVFLFCGLLATFVVQSSSGVTSAIVPLVSKYALSIF